MPELAEIKIMSDHINSLSGKNILKLRKSSISKNHLDKDLCHTVIDNKIKSVPRGKELQIQFDKSKKMLTFTMGMSGNWAITKTGDENKHTHLMIDFEDGITLGLVDPRRFAKWKQKDFDSKRSPDPVKEPAQFIRNILDNLDHSLFDKPICEVLLDQRFFNGIGNYLRAEILHRANINPTLQARKAIKRNDFVILKLCSTIPVEAELVGGGEFQAWKNPTSEAKENFSKWLQCYGKGYPFKDSTGRMMWTHPKFKNRLNTN